MRSLAVWTIWPSFKTSTWVSESRHAVTIAKLQSRSSHLGALRASRAKTSRQRSGPDRSRWKSSRCLLHPHLRPSLRNYNHRAPSPPPKSPRIWSIHRETRRRESQPIERPQKLPPRQKHPRRPRLQRHLPRREEIIPKIRQARQEASRTTRTTLTTRFRFLF